MQYSLPIMFEILSNKGGDAYDETIIRYWFW